MADISITATDVKLVAAWKQRTGPTDEALDAGEAVRYNTSNGKFTPANGSSEAESRVVGVALNTVTTAGEVSPTVVLGGIVDVGDALDSMSYDDDVWLSDTDGALATTPGSVPKRVGKVIPAWGATTADKLLLVEPELAGAGGDAAGIGFIALPLADWREIASNDIQTAADGAAKGSGGILASDTTPILEYTNGDTDSAIRINWAAGNTDPIAMQVPLPPDFNTATDLELHLRAGMGGSTDTPTIALDSFFNEGDTKVEDASGSVSDTISEVIATIAAADVPSGAQTLSVELTPGAHSTDALHVYAAWLEYART